MATVTVTSTVVDNRVVVGLEVGAGSMAAAEQSADREAETAQVRERLASEAYGKRADVQEMMQSMMQATVAARPTEPLTYMVQFLERQVQRREMVSELPHATRTTNNLSADPKEQALRFASRVDFQAICYRLSVSVVESKPQGEPPNSASQRKREVKVATRLGPPREWDSLVWLSDSLTLTTPAPLPRICHCPLEHLVSLQTPSSSPWTFSPI
jgi:hypothetical protein